MRATQWIWSCPLALLLFSGCLAQNPEPVDTTPPGEVTGLSVTPGDGSLALVWTEPSDADFDRVTITWDPPGGPQQPFIAQKGTEDALLAGLADETRYDLTLQTVDVAGNHSGGTMTCGTTLTHVPYPDFHLFDDSLPADWNQAPYGGIQVTLDATTPVHSGSHSLSILFNAGWCGCGFTKQTGSLDATHYDSLKLWINGGSGSGYDVVLRVLDGELNPVGADQHLTPKAGQWEEVSITFASLGDPAAIGGIEMFNNSGSTHPVFFVDDIRFLGK